MKNRRYVNHFFYYCNSDNIKKIRNLVFKVIEENRDSNGTDSFVFEEIVLPYGDKKCLWIDDVPKNNLHLMNLLENEGFSVFWRTSTEELIEMIESEKTILTEPLKNFKIVSDMVREEKVGGSVKKEYKAGAIALKILRDMNYQEPIAFYCGDKTFAQKNCEEAGVFNPANTKIYNSENEIREYLFNNK